GPGDRLRPGRLPGLAVEVSRGEFEDSRTRDRTRCDLQIVAALLSGRATFVGAVQRARRLTGDRSDQPRGTSPSGRAAAWTTSALQPARNPGMDRTCKETPSNRGTGRLRNGCPRLHQDSRVPWFSSDRVPTMVATAILPR